MVKSSKARMRVKHQQPMPGIENAFRDEDILDFDSRIKKALGTRFSFDYTVEPWIDGADVALIYEKGKLTMASTIGDGCAGEDVTANIKTILTVPLVLVEPMDGRPLPNLLEIMGMVYIESEPFEALNLNRIEKGLPPFSNPQSAAIASLREPNLRITAKRPLNMFCCGVKQGRVPAFDTQYELMLSLQRWGLRVNRPHIRVCRAIGEVLDACHRIGRNGSQFPFRIVGALITVNQIHLQARLGRKSNTPRWAIAFNMSALQRGKHLQPSQRDPNGPPFPY
jgi:DNA ligase (NAD+)